MDHLDLPHDRDSFEFTVPLFASEIHRYDDHDFETFPERCGFDLRDLIASKHPAEILSFVQAWLYFGTLAECLGPDFRQSDFLKYDDATGGQCINTSILSVHKAGWSRPWWYLNRNRRDLDRVRSILRKAAVACETLDRDLDDDLQYWSLLLLSIRVLIETLGTYAELEPLDAMHLDRPSLRPLMEHLNTKTGWCHHRLHQISKCRSYLTAIFLAKLRRHLKPWISHSECSSLERCAAYNIDNTTFASQHVSAGCQCEHVSAKTTDMLDILREGGIPVVRCEYSRDGVPRLSYVKASPGARYAAISHLWADGLGNPVGNTLPLCQVQKLVQHVMDANRMLDSKPDTLGVNTLNPFLRSEFWTPDSQGIFNITRKMMSYIEHPVVDFWLDTYCVPIVPRNASSYGEDDEPVRSDVQRLKEIALQQMYATYSWSRYVLVLDQEFLHLDNESDDVEFYARVLLSGWNTRCWTLQEYCLSQKVVFQCQSPRRRWKLDLYNQRKSSGNVLRDMIFRALWHMSAPIPVFSSGHPEYESGAEEEWLLTQGSASKFSIAWNALVSRETTKMEDVPRILVNLMGLIGQHGSPSRTEDVMKSAVASETWLPLALLFIETARLDSEEVHSFSELPQDRWVPKAPYNSGTIPSGGMPELIVTGNGLILRDHRYGSQWQVLETLCPGIDEWTLTLDDLSIHITLRTNNQQALSGRALIILDHKPESTLAEARKSPTRSQGCCLLISSDTGNVVHTTYFCPIYWQIASGPLIDDPGNERSCKGQIFDVRSRHVQIDCDIASWRAAAGTYMSMHFQQSFTGIVGVLTFSMFMALMIFVAPRPIWSLIRALHEALGDSILGTLLFVVIMAPSVWMLLAMVKNVILIIVYPISEATNFVFLSQNVSNAGGSVSWRRNVEMALPKDRHTMGIYRYYAVIPIVRALLVMNRWWRMCKGRLRLGGRRDTPYTEVGPIAL